MLKMNKLKCKMILENIKAFFSLKCPECKGILKAEKFDYHFDIIVYKCSKCGIEWI